MLTCRLALSSNSVPAWRSVTDVPWSCKTHNSIWKMPAPAVTSTTPTLEGSAELIKYMEDALRQLEEAQGGADEQARAQLDKLRQQTASLSSIQTQTQRAASTAPAVDELVLAGQLDKLDGQLQQLESSIANADPATKELLSKSTALWLKEQSDVSQS